MSFSSSNNEVVQVTDRADLGGDEGLDGEITGDDQDHKGMEVICQEGCLDTTDEGIQDDTDR